VLIIGTLEDAGTEKKAFDVIAAVKIKRQLHHFFHRETVANAHALGVAETFVEVLPLAPAGRTRDIIFGRVC
jgi:uncharacterized protein (DUF2062 family)